MNALNALLKRVKRWLRMIEFRLAIAGLSEYDLKFLLDRARQLKQLDEWRARRQNVSAETEPADRVMYPSKPGRSSR